MPASAFAFLGGRFMGASGGWGSSRSLEEGVAPGFHPFSRNQIKKTDLNLGVEARRFAAILLYSRAAGLGIKRDFMTRILDGSFD